MNPLAAFMFTERESKPRTRGVTMIADMIAGTPARFDASIYAPNRFAGDAADEAWLRREVAAAPSSSYRRKAQT